MKLEIIGPQHIFTHDIVWIEIETPSGNRIIQPEHAPMISLLSQNKPMVFCLEDGEEKSIVVTDGIIQITRSSVTVLITGNNEKNNWPANRRISD